MGGAVLHGKTRFGRGRHCPGGWGGRGAGLGKGQGGVRYWSGWEAGMKGWEREEQVAPRGMAGAKEEEGEGAAIPP